MEIENEINNENNNKINREINNEIKLEENQNNFLESMFGKAINSAIDIGLRAILPDLIENQIIDIKNSLFENGIKGGIKTAVNSTVDFAKSTVGIFTGKFQNVSQIQTAIGSGGIIDTFSNLLDKAINKTYESGHINETIYNVIKNGKNILLDNITNNIKNELNNQNNSIEKLKIYIENWKDCYKNKDFEGMTKEYNKIANQLNNVIPMENILKDARDVEKIHNLIKNNGYNFEITDIEKELINKFV